MKVNLLINGTNVLGGYLNIDPYAKEGDGKILGDITNLDHCVDDDELEELVADSILEYFGLNIVGGIIKNWVDKLQKGGKITLVCPDIYEIAKAISRRDLSEDEANILLFGPQDKEGVFKRNVYSMEKIEQILTYLNVKITSKKFLGFKLVITGEKM